MAVEAVIIIAPAMPWAALRAISAARRRGEAGREQDGREDSQTPREASFVAAEVGDPSHGHQRRGGCQNVGERNPAERDGRHVEFRPDHGQGHVGGRHGESTQETAQGDRDQQHCPFAFCTPVTLPRSNVVLHEAPARRRWPWSVLCNAARSHTAVL